MIAILASLLLMLLGLYVFKSKDSSSSENKKPRRRADIPNRDEDGQIIQGNLFKGIVKWSDVAWHVVIFKVNYSGLGLFDRPRQPVSVTIFLYFNIVEQKPQKNVGHIWFPFNK